MKYLSDINTIEPKPLEANQPKHLKFSNHMTAAEQSNVKWSQKIPRPGLFMVFVDFLFSVFADLRGFCGG